MKYFLNAPASLLCLALSACGFGREVGALYSPPTIPLAIELISVINTQKTLGDHVMSLITGKDCSLIRATKDGEYCIVKEEWQPQPPQQVYCYRSLAHVSCYTQPLMVGNDTLVVMPTPPKKTPLPVQVAPQEPPPEVTAPQPPPSPPIEPPPMEPPRPLLGFPPAVSGPT